MRIKVIFIEVFNLSLSLFLLTSMWCCKAKNQSLENQSKEEMKEAFDEVEEDKEYVSEPTMSDTHMNPSETKKTNEVNYKELKEMLDAHQGEKNTMEFQKLKKDSLSIWNDDHSMKLILSIKTKVGDPARHFNYWVYKGSTQEIVTKGYYRGTAIEWNTSSSLKLIPYIGMVREDMDSPTDDQSKINSTKTIQILKLN